jgi:hypothetical protein
MWQNEEKLIFTLSLQHYNTENRRKVPSDLVYSATENIFFLLI